MPKIKGRVDGPVLIDTTGKTWVVGKSALITSLASGIFENGANNNTYLIEGRIIAEGAAIEINSLRCKIGIAGSGLLAGGIAADSLELKIDNAGEIWGADAIDAAAEKFTLVNSGLVKGGFGMSLNVSDGRIINERSGVIEATSDAIYADGSREQGIDVVNRGRIEAVDDAVYISSAAGNHLINRGVIVGNLFLGDGNDVFDLVGGHVDGTIFGEMGDDLMITDSHDSLRFKDWQGDFPGPALVSHAFEVEF